MAHTEGTYTLNIDILQVIIFWHVAALSLEMEQLCVPKSYHLRPYDNENNIPQTDHLQIIYVSSTDHRHIYR